MGDPIIDHHFKAMEAVRDYEQMIEDARDAAQVKSPSTPRDMLVPTMDFNAVQLLTAKVGMHSQLAVRDAIKEQTTAMREQSELMAAALADNMSPEQAKNFLKVVTGQVESGSKK